MRARHSLGSAGMLPAVSGIMPDNSAGLRVALLVGGVAVLRFAQEPPATCRRQRAECSRSPTLLRAKFLLRPRA
jgi:hypothetical protein